jgi:hypothetical protein
VSTDSMPMYDSLADQIKYFLLNGGDYHVAPDLGADVLDVVDDFVARFEVLSHDYYRHTQVLWIAHTWLMDVWEHTPRLLFVSPEASCGKTRALTVTRHLVPRPDHVADLSPAGLYHSIDHGLEFRGGRPTILHDEFDTVFPTPRSNEEMRKLINAGHDRYETLNRKIGKETKRFQLYAPMALAGKMTIFDVPDTIRSRSIIIPMQRRLPHEKIERWNRHIHTAEAESLRWLLRYWVEFVHGYALDYVGPDRPVLPKGIEDRDADCWEPMLAVADWAGGHWPERARVAAVAAVAASGVKAVPSLGVQLLEDIRTVFDKTAAERLLTETLLEHLKILAPSRWRRLDANGLARLLAGYNVKPRESRIGKQVRRGYRREWFEDAWTRYLEPATPATPATKGDDDDE